MARYTYTFDIKGGVEIEACNLQTACEKLLDDKYGLNGFLIQRRGTAYLANTKFEDRTHIVIFDSGVVCEVKQRKNF